MDFHAVFGARAERGCFAFVRPLEDQQGDGVVGPGGMIWNTAVSLADEIKLPTRIINWNGESPILVYVIVQYRDIFGVTRKSKTCAESLGNGQFKYMPGQSWMDY